MCEQTSFPWKNGGERKRVNRNFRSGRRLGGKKLALTKLGRGPKVARGKSRATCVIYIDIHFFFFCLLTYACKTHHKCCLALQVIFVAVFFFFLVCVGQGQEGAAGAGGSVCFSPP